MIAASYDYITGAKLLWANHKPAPAFVVAAIGLEILLKSFLAEVDGPPGGIGEQYLFDKRAHGIKGHGHNLLELFNAAPPDVISRLQFGEYRSWIEDYFQEPFVRARYPYEKGASASYSSVLIEIAEEMLDKVVRAYKAQGCDDPWIIQYPNC
jgi:hypothetical protein